MRYLTFSNPERSIYPIALLVKSLRRLELQEFVKGFEQEVVAYTLPGTKKPKNDEMKAFLAQLLPVLCGLQTEYLLVTDANYFKVLTKSQRVDRFAGYVLPCVLKDFEHMNVIYMPSAAQIIRDPTQRMKLDQGLRALHAHRTGSYIPPGSTVIHFAEYPDTPDEIAKWLEKLLDVDLSIDIETFSLKHYNAGIGTITLCWSQHEGIAFCVDKDRNPADASKIRVLLRAFFEARVAKTLYHRAWFDVYVLVYQLFMEDVLDTESLLYGMEIMLRNFEDTQLIRYLATNSCAGNKLSLKDVAQEFAGNYAVEVSDIAKVSKEELQVYNLIDGLSTWYAYNKHYPQMVADQQRDIYENLFKPCMRDIIQMQLTGMPMDMQEVLKGEAIMAAERDRAVARILQSPYVTQMNQWIARRWALKRNAELKVKQVTEADCKETFNINSNPQLQVMLHELMKLPVLESTDSGQPATGMDAIEGLIHHAQDNEQREVLSALIEFKLVEKILSSFIPAFKSAYLAPDGWHYLYGNYNLGGALSGRLSSSDPNMQNIPANAINPLTKKPSIYPKLVKKMFKAPPGKLFVGLDFSSLEDRISALTTKDPNKLKVYTDGYDGHSLRTLSYFREQLPPIDENDVAAVNAIQNTYSALRQDSKAPTFALTYQGTWRTLVTNCGFTPELAKEIEERYHELYQVSDQWVQAKLTQAAKDGYVTVAFGLRLRTPMMQQTVMNTRATPYEAVAEGRTAGNALGQSYCMLNSRAAKAFMQKVRKSEYRLRIRICAQIHDAMYFIVDNDADLLAWMNIHLVEEVQWQDLPDIRHPDVKLGGELLVFYPTWANELTIPNGADATQILHLAKEHAKQ